MSLYSNAIQLMAGLLSVPCSDADAEQGLSVLRKIHIDQRSTLDQSTIVSLMSIKFTCDSCYLILNSLRNNFSQNQRKLIFAFAFIIVFGTILLINGCGISNFLNWKVGRYAAARRGINMD